MNRGHAVGAVRANHRQVRHADLAHRPLFYQAHALHARLVAGIKAADVVEKAAIDLVDDLQVPGNQQLRSSSTGQRSSASGSSV